MATEAHDTVTQALPTPGAGPQMMMVEVALIEESPSNPRKTFDPLKLQELAESIKASGVHQPILLRPLPGHRVPDTWGFRRQGAPLPAYELVAGARRLRACKMASVAEVPAMIRELTDEQALEIQVIENLQREDVTALEEAEGYEALMQHGHANADQVAAKIGKSRAYVYARLKLLDLCQQAREALREGKIDFSRGLLIARIPDEGLQIKALKYCSESNYYGEPRGYRDCAQHVQQNYMLKLSSAKFKTTDATLVPKAGSCRECPKRTGANPDLFQDVDGADVCTDPKCYHAKEEAHSAAQKKAALESGAHIIEGREAKALMPNAWSSEVKGYLRLDDKCDSPTDKPLRKLIGKAMELQGIKPTLVANPHKEGELVAVITPDQAEVLLKAANQEEAAAKLEQEAHRDAEAEKRQAASAAKTAFEEQWRWDLLTTAWDQIRNGTHEAPSDAVMRGIATTMAKGLNQDRAKKLCKLLDLGKVAPVAGVLQYIADTDAPADALQLMVMFQDVEYRHWIASSEANTALLQVAQDYGVDLEKVKAQTKTNQRAATKAKTDREAAKTAAPEGASTPRPAAQASPTRGKGKAQKPKADPAAPKTTKAEASAAIAAALRATEEPIQAPAAQGIEAPPAPTGGDAPAPGGEGGAGAGDGAAVETAKGLKVGDVATVKATAANVKWRGRKVTVLSVGSTIKVREANTSPAKAERCSFFEDDLEVV
jgi:ParB/RepB/Spo0J family partition protein